MRPHLQKLLLLFLACAAGVGAAPLTWESVLQDRLPLYGHRNWIVIADSAYPDQSREGIETILADASESAVLNQVLTILSHSRHVRPIIYTDSELNFVSENDAGGISAFRRDLQGLFSGQPVLSLPHEQIISRLDQAAQAFRVLIIKTRMTLPYTSVFLQLDCAYWSADAEKRLRQTMASGSSQ